jgi:DNA-binding transcriptional LysR family regulator
MYIFKRYSLRLAIEKSDNNPMHPAKRLPLDVEQARTFLAIVARGSFLEAAHQLNLTQSTVSARIRALEEALGVRLFQRNRAGASLTLAGRRFLPHAQRLVRVAEQAWREVGLPSRYRSTLRVGARIALWEGLLPAWLARLRRLHPDVAVEAEIGFEADLQGRLTEGSLDLAFMYSPTHTPGLVVRHLFDETLVLVSDRPRRRPGREYIHVRWGPGFDQQEAAAFPGLEPPPRVVNVGWLAVQLLLAEGGSCYLPWRMAQPFVEAGRFHVLRQAPRLALPAYGVYREEEGQGLPGTALGVFSGLLRLAQA